MAFMFVLEFIITIGVLFLILITGYKMFKRASVDDKVSHLQVVDEQYEEVVDASKKYKNSEEKEKKIKNFIQ